MRLKWKPNWEEAREHHLAWWRGEGFVLAKYWPPLPAAAPHEDIACPGPPVRPWLQCSDPVFLARQSCYNLSRQSLAGDILPFADTDMGPGSLACLIGAEPVFSEETVWFEPCITDPETHPPLRFDPANRWWKLSEALLVENVRLAQGRFLVPCPDLVENLDILASLRGTQPLLMDLIERPEWVKARLEEINQAYFDAYDRTYGIIQGDDGSSSFGAFWIWGPGKTIKVQCDISAMLSPELFEEFAQPYLQKQCQWADHSLYHLDGSQAIQHLDRLLDIEDLDAIEFTPEPNKPSGSNPYWFDLYRRIREAGKSVQIVDARQCEVIPLLEALGPEGFYLCVSDFNSETELIGLYEAVRRFRT